MEDNPNFTPKTQRVIKGAKKIAQEFNNEEITLEHLFVSLLEVDFDMLDGLFYVAQVERSDFREYFMELIEKGSFEEDSVSYSGDFLKCLYLSTECAKKIGHEYIGVEHLFLTLISNNNKNIVLAFKDIGLHRDDICDYVQGYLDGEEDEGEGGAATGHPMIDIEEMPEFEVKHLEKYGMNYNALVAENGSKVIGKEKEILRMSEILCSKTKNNPILLGEPGVGKTAVVEGLAQKIVTKECSDFLLGKVIYELNMSSMVAGTKYRGQFEERLKNVIDEVTTNPDIILFIDEIHTLIGAGGAEGAMDAANILKPLLARGQLKCIGATTRKEYKKSVEKDGALDRRFQPIIINEPTRDEAVEILKGIAPKYEEFHGVKYDDSTYEKIVDFSIRYISDKHLPDKAIDILDRVAAKVKLREYTRPDKAKEIEAQLEQMFLGLEDPKEAEEKFVEVQNGLLLEYKELLDNWAKECEENQARISDKDVYEVISEKTGIPIVDISGESEKILNLKKYLEQEVIGQDEAIEEISKCILRSKAGINDETKPLGSFLLAGESGLGKTLTAKALAKLVFNGEENIIRFDMSEYGEKASAARLVGASPGYVGYEEGGQITEAVKKKPYSLILFDEIEKAHDDVIDLLLQILSDGQLTDNFGKTANFRNTIILITSNVSEKKESFEKSMGFVKTSNFNFEEYKKASVDKVKRYFKPEFIDRLNKILVYKPFDEESLRKIVRLEINKLTTKLEKNGYAIDIANNAIEFILKKTIETNLGARLIKKIIEDSLENYISELIISKKISKTDLFSIVYEKNEEFGYIDLV